VGVLDGYFNIYPMRIIMLIETNDLWSEQEVFDYLSSILPSFEDNDKENEPKQREFSYNIVNLDVTGTQHKFTKLTSPIIYTKVEQLSFFDTDCSGGAR
jgi:hypothetical protein